MILAEPPAQDIRDLADGGECLDGPHDRSDQVGRAGSGVVERLERARVLRRDGSDIEVLVNGNAAAVMDRLRARSPETMTAEALTLEDIFVSTLQPEGAAAV